jgi:hypothetical protein
MAARAIVLLFCLVASAGCASSPPVARFNPIAVQQPAPQPSPSPSPLPSPSPTPSHVPVAVAVAPPARVPACWPFTLTGFGVRPDGQGKVLISWSTRGGCAPYYGYAGTTSFTPSGVNTTVSFHTNSGSGSVVLPLPFYCHGESVVVTVYLTFVDGGGYIIQPEPTATTTAIC